MAIKKSVVVVVVVHGNYQWLDASIFLEANYWRQRNQWWFFSQKTSKGETGDCIEEIMCLLINDLVTCTVSFPFQYSTTESINSILIKCNKRSHTEDCRRVWRSERRQRLIVHSDLWSGSYQLCSVTCPSHCLNINTAQQSTSVIENTHMHSLTHYTCSHFPGKPELADCRTENNGLWCEVLWAKWPSWCKPAEIHGALSFLLHPLWLLKWKRRHSRLHRLSQNRAPQYLLDCCSRTSDFPVVSACSQPISVS